MGHGLDGKLCCVWCKGLLSWFPKQKMKHADHLIACSTEFLESLTVAFHGESNKESDRHLSEDSSLNMAADAVRRFLDDDPPMRWFHATVRYSSHDLFLKTFLRDPSHIHLLHSSWCTTDDDEGTHRHVILAFPISEDPSRLFEDFLGTVHAAPIASGSRLVDWIIDLSLDTGADRRCPSRDVPTTNYNALQPFSCGGGDARLYLLMQWDNASLERQGFGRKDLKRKALSFVSSELRTADETSPYVLHLPRGEKMTFEWTATMQRKKRKLF